MSSVKSVTVFSSMAWGAKYKRRYEVTLIDEQNENKTYVLGVFIVNNADNGYAFAEQYLSSLKNNEIESYKNSVRSGINPFTKKSLWNNRHELLLPILTDALSLPATDDIVINGLPYLSLVADAELMLIFSKDQIWVDNIRLIEQQLLNSKSILDNYVPILGAI